MRSYDLGTLVRRSSIIIADCMSGLRDNDHWPASGPMVRRIWYGYGCLIQATEDEKRERVPVPGFESQVPVGSTAKKRAFVYRGATRSKSWRFDRENRFAGERTDTDDPVTSP